MRLTGGRGRATLSAVRSPIMSTRTAPNPAAVAALRAAAVVEVPATCWWHGLVHHYGR